MTPARPRPLLVREGARYRCCGDGVCCTDVHLLGPVTRSERRRLTLLVGREHLVRNELLVADVLRTGQGRCHFLEVDGCALHRTHGAPAKPAGCRRFPYRLVATPVGGRVVTEHRCPCRTMGQRPPISVVDAEASLRDDAGRLAVDARIGDRVPIAPRRRVSFARWLEIESALLTSIARSDDVARALEAEPMPEIPSFRWTDVAHHFRARLDGTACGDALAWFGDVLLDLAEGTRRRPARVRPWAHAFDRAEARSEEQDPARMLADWVADVVWSLEWCSATSLLTLRIELATRVAIGREVARRIVSRGARADRAMAEALLVVELAGESGLWATVCREIERALRLEAKSA